MWSIGLCKFHRDRAITETAERCKTHLSVTWPYGLAFEFSATLVVNVVSSTNFTDRSHRPLERHAKSLITIIVAVSSKLTGFKRNTTLSK